MRDLKNQELDRVVETGGEMKTTTLTFQERKGGTTATPPSDDPSGHED